MKELAPSEFPPLLREINDPPEKLFIEGVLPDSQEYKYLCVVGSRAHTRYGKEACEMLIKGLAGYPIVIVSGLAIGMDTIAHRAALAANLPTVAVPGSGLHKNVLYPRSNMQLATDITNAGGALLSEFEPLFKATPWSFPQRNRIMAGLSHATLVIEAAGRSGTLITARLAADYNRDVLAVPGPITSPVSVGPHELMKVGATPVTTPRDILQALHIPERAEAAPSSSADLTAEERAVLAHLAEPCHRDELIEKLGLPAQAGTVLISMLELKGHITIDEGIIRATVQL